MPSSFIPLVILISLLPVALLLYGVYTFIYNIFFHPLRSFPGPLVGRTTRLWGIYHDVSGDFHVQIKALHDKYGEVVRFAPNELSYNTGRAWHEIYGHRSQKLGAFVKDPLFFARPDNHAPSILAANEEDHRRMRKLQSHAFSEKALTGQQGIIMKHIDLFISELHKRASGPDTCFVDMVRWYNYTTLDIIGDLALGQPFGCLRDGDSHPFIGAVFKSIKHNSYVRAARRFPSPVMKCLRWMLPTSLQLDRVKYTNWAFESARKRMAEETDRHDFSNDEKGMTPSEIESNVQLYISAGSETTATLLSAVTFYLLSNPRVMSILVAELQKSFESDSQITMNSTQHLPYLHAVLEEGLRMFPPAPNTFPRETPFPGVTICGKYVPGGTSVGVNQWASLHAPENFVEPDSFIPERFLGDPLFEDDDKTAFNPFSYGPRNCIGKNLAYVEMKIILSRVLWNFKLELQPDSYLWDKDMKTFLAWEKPDLNVKLTRRQAKNFLTVISIEKCGYQGRGCCIAKSY